MSINLHLEIYFEKSVWKIPEIWKFYFILFYFCCLKENFILSSGQNIPLVLPELVLNICKQCNWIYVFWFFLMCRFDSTRPPICSTTKFSFFWHRSSIRENNWTGEADTGKLLNYIYYLDLLKIRVYSLLLIELKKTSKRKKKAQPSVGSCCSENKDKHSGSGPWLPF